MYSHIINVVIQSIQMHGLNNQWWYLFYHASLRSKNPCIDHPFVCRSLSERFGRLKLQITISPVYSAAIGVDPKKFPSRKIKFPEQAASSDQVADMYRAK
ncbi:hypothetical protein NE237_008878 [Protea cynaroides]|uniref:Uncharacterized protein n=1 Tax=Protea cynaroides TaxID=273540 RepID=A0A9Q0KWD2_9MAGN|nr:hypothetical protein NE237_008878 [Protea cynaroides]